MKPVQARYLLVLVGLATNRHIGIRGRSRGDLQCRKQCKRNPVSNLLVLLQRRCRIETRSTLLVTSVFSPYLPTPSQPSCCSCRGLQYLAPL
ncbi:hypothetical protein DAEQUDRAFT_729734 [Daedalea quercina L-15889]|uniref:Uncharacterized protein n=1 Tax=Daedalea quercina L-15889 TaxID=1314783 RepID=A0A165NGF8_9APHY|nr:hypothetical protein DAEQUDRAFT_729734 [Daedalea quercina L-15889]